MFMLYVVRIVDVIYCLVKEKKYSVSALIADVLTGCHNGDTFTLETHNVPCKQGACFVATQ